MAAHSGGAAGRHAGACRALGRPGRPGRRPAGQPVRAAGQRTAGPDRGPGPGTGRLAADGEGTGPAVLGHSADPPTIREALRRLQATETVVLRHGSGVYAGPGVHRTLMINPNARPAQAKLALELVEARLTIEPGIAALAARRRTTDQLGQLELALETARQDPSDRRPRLNFHREPDLARDPGTAGNGAAGHHPAGRLRAARARHGPADRHHTGRGRRGHGGRAPQPPGTCRPRRRRWPVPTRGTGHRWFFPVLEAGQGALPSSSCSIRDSASASRMCSSTRASGSRTRRASRYTIAASARLTTKPQPRPIQPRPPS